MKAKNRSLPYPVLSPFRDDVMPNVFEVKVTPSSDRDNYYLDCDFHIVNPTLLSLIKQGTANYTLHIECRNNFFREMVQTSEPHVPVKIPSDQLTGTVELSFFVTANNPIVDYSVVGSHSDYESSTFEIRQGDILAIAPSVTFEAEKEYDPLKKISSIMRIGPMDDVPDGRMDVALDSDKILVFLSPADFQRYGTLKETQGVASVLIQCISLPALSEAISNIRNSEGRDNDGQSRWFRLIHRRLTEIDPNCLKSSKTSLELAQQLLNNPLGRCLHDLHTLTEKETTS